MMNFIKNNLANALTLGNLFCGSIAVIHIINNDYQIAAICLVLSLVLDFFDGFVARALKSNSNLGAQLDSLADMVSFGVAPGLIMFNLLEPFGSSFLGLNLPFEIKYLGLLITVFSCLRLAIFNLDEEQRASRVEQDNTNKAIAGTSNVFNKYISSRSDADISKFKVDEGINRDLTDKLYQLENQQLQADIIGKDYEMQMSEINKKIADIEFELNRTDIDAAQKASLKSYQDSYKKMAEDIEKRRINNQIKGK